MRHLVILSALYVGLSQLPGCVADVGEGESPEPDETLITAATSPTSSTTSGTIRGDGWITKQITLTETSDVSASLNWSKTSVNLNLYLQTSTGARIVDARSTTARPETVSAAALAPGNYRVAIKNASSVSTGYTLTVTVTPKVVVPPPPPPPATYPGQPAPGTVFWGAGVGGNSDVVSRHETPSAQTLGIRRTFWTWDKRTTSMITMARTDLENGRLPWVSIKPPSWTAMGNGTHDAEIDQMLNALKALPGPVWLTLHHEPEGGGGVNAPDDPGGPSAHVAMNRRVRERMTALAVKNVALAPILMAWSFTSQSGRNPDQWWAPGIYDFFGTDHYTDAEATLLNSTFQAVRTWAKAKGVDVGVAEWGMRGTDAAAGARVRAWYDGAIASQSDGKGARVTGLCAFDSYLNSPSGSWELVGGQLDAFWALLGDPRTASVDAL